MTVSSHCSFKEETSSLRAALDFSRENIWTESFHQLGRGDDPYVGYISLLSKLLTGQVAQSAKSLVNSISMSPTSLICKSNPKLKFSSTTRKQKVAWSISFFQLRVLTDLN